MRKEAVLRFGVRVWPHGVAAYVNSLELAVQRHMREWGLGILFWKPFALQVTVGPISVLLGVAGDMDFYGLGLSYMRPSNGNTYWAVYMSGDRWWESA